jgi:hypothetical protein
MPGALLQTGDAREDSKRDAIFRAKDDIQASSFILITYGGQQESTANC